MVKTGRTSSGINTGVKVGKEGDYLIRPAERGGGFLLYKAGKAVEIVRQTNKWIKKTAAKYGLTQDDITAAMVEAKTIPKIKPRAEMPLQFEIVTSSVYQTRPDGGVIDGRAYLGLWLPVKIDDRAGKRLSRVFHLLFSDGELIPGDPETLGERGIYLTTNPIYTPLKISVETVLNLAELGRVDPCKLLDQLMQILGTYIEFDDPRYYTLCAVWIIGTYFYKHFSAYPYLFINALKRSGKTKLLTVLSLLAYNAVFSANMSTSSLFRLTQSAGATTLADETEDLNDPERRADFRQLFNSGYKRGALVYRTEKGPNDTYVPTPYDPYSPKGLANITGLEDVLEDRCIPITMKRGRNRKIINRDVPIDDLIWIEARDSLSRLYFQEWSNIEQTYNETADIDNVVSVVSVDSVMSREVQKEENIFSGRDWELWRPLLSITKKIFSSCPTPHITTLTTPSTLTTPLEQLLGLAIDSIKEKEAENVTDTGEALLMMGLLSLVQVDSYYGLSVMKEAAARYSDDLPGWFNNRWIGRGLKRLGFKEKRRRGRGVEYRLTPGGVKDMADRLHIKLPKDSSEPREKAPGDKMKDRARALLIENSGSLDYRTFFNKMNEEGYHGEDIEKVVFSDLRFTQDGLMVHYEEDRS